jgi:hypothetical protein
MIESISAITLATHSMRRAVHFYRMLGFEVVYGGDDAAFTSFSSWKQLSQSHRPTWRSGVGLGGDVSSSTIPTLTPYTRAWSQPAIRSNPRDPSIFFRHSGLAMAHFIAGNFNEAVEWAQKSVNRKREWYRAHLLLIAGLAHSGKLDEARAAVGVYLSVFPNGSLCDADRTPLNCRLIEKPLLLGFAMQAFPNDNAPSRRHPYG